MSKKRTPRLTREQLCLMAGAKAQVIAAETQRRDAFTAAETVEPGSAVAALLRVASTAAAQAREAIFARLDGQVDESE